MKRYIAVLELDDEDEILDAKVSYFYSSNGMTYKATEKMELKEENEDAKNKTYEDGLNEAWNMARKIVCMPQDGGESEEWLEKTFGTARTDCVLRNFSASEAIDVIERSEKIKVGDEIVDKYGWKKVVTKTHNSGDITIMDCNGEFYECCKKAWKMSGFKKTGRNFPQIEEVLKQIKEGEDE